MNEKVRKTVVYMTLPAAIIWAVFNLPGHKTDEPSPSVTTQKTSPPVNALAPNKPDTRLINIEHEEHEDWGRDPFRTYLYSRSGTPTQHDLAWVLRGIVYSPEQPLAFINNQSVRVGDVVDDATVVSISKKEVVVDHKGQEITLTVNKG